MQYISLRCNHKISLVFSHLSIIIAGRKTKMLHPYRSFFCTFQIKVVPLQPVIYGYALYSQ